MVAVDAIPAVGVKVGKREVGVSNDAGPVAFGAGDSAPDASRGKLQASMNVTAKMIRSSL